MKLKQHALLAGAVMAVSFSASSQGLAQEAPDWIESARHYAREARVSEGEAVRRIRLQAAISDLQAKLAVRGGSEFRWHLRRLEPDELQFCRPLYR